MIDTIFFIRLCYVNFQLNTYRKEKYCTLVHVANLLCVTIFALILSKSFYIIGWPCYNINDCAVWLLSWNHVTVAILILLSASTLRRAETSRCFDNAITYSRKCYSLHRKSLRTIIYYCITTMIVFFAKTMTSLQHGKNDGVFLLYSLTYLVPLSMECLVICFCTVVRDTFRKINEILDQLSRTNYNNVLLAWNLKKLMKLHQQACNLMYAINACFDKDLLIDLVFNMIWFVIYIYIMIVALWNMESFSDRKVRSIMLEILFLTVRVCFLSYSVNSIETEKHKILVKTRDFQQSKKLNALCSALTREFSHQVIDHEMKLHVCGCFYVDLSFMRGIISLATTYLVVFIQYGLEPSSKLADTSTSSQFQKETLT